MLQNDNDEGVQANQDGNAEYKEVDKDDNLSNNVEGLSDENMEMEMHEEEEEEKDDVSDNVESDKLSAHSRRSL